MSRRESVKGFIDAEYSSGDSNRTKTICQEGAKKAEEPSECQEENNNEIDHLSKQLDEMGCIVDAVKRPPNICVENCVHAEDSESEDVSEGAKTVVNKDEGEDAYSDEFEEASDAEDKANKEDEAEDKTETLTGASQAQLELKTASRMSFVNVPKPVSVNSGSSYGSIPVPKTHRVNMSFSNDRLREIERHNHILLNKIVSARNTRKSSIPPWDQEVRRTVPTAALLRRKDQRKIDHENMILLKKIQRAKSSSCSMRH